MISRFVFVICVLLFSSAFAEEESYNDSDIVKICGIIVKQETRYDGIKSIFSQMDESGNLLKSIKRLIFLAH